MLAVLGEDVDVLVDEGGTVEVPDDEGAIEVLVEELETEEVPPAEGGALEEPLVLLLGGPATAVELVALFVEEAGAIRPSVSGAALV